MSKIIKYTFQSVFEVGKFLFKSQVLSKKTGADFSTKSSYSKYLSADNRGLLINGSDLKLTEKKSFQNICLVASVGAGKTTRFIIPNILERAKSKCSIVVHDPKGEVFDLTSQYLKNRGYNIILIDPENIERSSCFNPLLEAKTDIELEQITEILIEAGLKNAKSGDDFFSSGAKRFVSLFLKCLKIASLKNKNLMTLSNLYYLFQNFGEKGENLENWVIENTFIPDDPEDRTLWNEWKGVLTGNKEGIQSFILNSITSLQALSNKNIAKLTARSDFDLANIRKEKTIIYFVTPPQHIEYYSFLTSLFFRSVFNSCMRKLPNKRDLPIYILYDEFGHSTIPNFVSTSNTIRGYNVSLSIVLQSISQLSARYGRDYALAIQGGFATYITYSGSDQETTTFFERKIGKVRERQKEDITNITDHYKEYNLINANEIRTIADDKGLLISSNNNPVLFKSKGYYEIRKYLKMSKFGSVNIPISNKKMPEFIKL
jgi:type IV secretory pathway TraG/TraD family ATPase VirD4